MWRWGSDTPSPHVLTLTKREVNFSGCHHSFCYHFKIHVGVRNDLDLFCTFWCQDLVTIFVTYESFKLVVQRIVLRVKFAHYLVAVNWLGVLELVGALFFIGDDFCWLENLIFYFDVFFVGVRTDTVLEIALMLQNPHGYAVMWTWWLVSHFYIRRHLFSVVFIPFEIHWVVHCSICLGSTRARNLFLKSAIWPKSWHIWSILCIYWAW